MLNEKIKKLFGEELATKVEEALKGKGAEGADLELGIVNDGSFYSKEAYEEEHSKGEANSKLVEDIVAMIKEYGGTGDVKAVKRDIQTAIENLKKDSAQQVLNTKKEYNLKAKLKENGVIDEDCLIYKHGGIDKFNFDEEGNVVGIEDILKPYHSSASYLFKPENEVQLRNAHSVGIGGNIEGFDGNASLAEQINSAMGIQ